MNKFGGIGMMVWGLMAFGFTQVGCDDKPGLFQACPLSQSILNACAEESDSTLITCIVERHPMCDEQVCASWESSESFCSRVCDVAGDCPIASKCRDHEQTGYCVPDDIPNTIER